MIAPHTGEVPWQLREPAGHIPGALPVSENCHERPSPWPLDVLARSDTPPMIAPWRTLSLLVCCGLFFSATGVHAGDAPLTRPQAYERAAQLVSLGRKLFADPALSGRPTYSSARTARKWRGE